MGIPDPGPNDHPEPGDYQHRSKRACDLLPRVSEPCKPGKADTGSGADHQSHPRTDPAWHSRFDLRYRVQDEPGFWHAVDLPDRGASDCVKPRDYQYRAECAGDLLPGVSRLDAANLDDGVDLEPDAIDALRPAGKDVPD